MTKRFADEEVIRILCEVESRDELVKDPCIRHNISEQTIYCWGNKFSGTDAPTPVGSRIWNRRTSDSSA